uniref:Methyltransferase type 11 n=1 Tax=Cyanothece sp. (strain PCC 7425 / ATCC 29141) TaxID=395961 RepID=B8HQR3_CYAP4
MSAPYDRIAQQYKRSKQLPFRLHSEMYTYLQLLGDVSGQTVLDLACGDGTYSRLLKRQGAARVVGVDMSEKMIELAVAEETRAPLGIEYLVSTAEDIGKIDQFDLVVAAFLLNYAQTREQLQQMCESIALNLKPGGRFVGINNNQEQPPETYPKCAAYGFIKTIAGPLQSGRAITYIFIDPDTQQEFRFDNYYLGQTTYDAVLTETGFTDVSWHTPLISAAGVEEFGQVFWQDFLSYPPILFLTFSKPDGDRPV